MSHQPDPSFTHLQYEFTRHLRDPEQPVAAEVDKIEDRRLAIYRELVYNNIEGFIATSFPVIKQLVNETVWHDMVRDFIIKHRCKTPLFHEIAREFLSYLESERDVADDPVFLKELAHYEWVELALSILDSDSKPLILNENKSVLPLNLQLSPLAWSLRYTYPVHKISTDFQPETPEEIATFLLVYRDNDDEVIFIELNPVSARLLELLNQGLTGQQAAEQISEELQHPNPTLVVDGAHALITDWIQRQVLVAASK